MSTTIQANLVPLACDIAAQRGDQLLVVSDGQGGLVCIGVQGQGEAPAPFKPPTSRRVMLVGKTTIRSQVLSAFVANPLTAEEAMNKLLPGGTKNPKRQHYLTCISQLRYLKYLVPVSEDRNKRYPRYRVTPLGAKYINAHKPGPMAKTPANRHQPPAKAA